IAHTNYDKRALTSTDPMALAASLQNLSYLTNVQSQAMAPIMAADGAICILVDLVRSVGRRIRGLEGPDDPLTDWETITTEEQALERMKKRAGILDIDRLTHTYALTTLTHLAVKGSRMVKERMVDAGLVPALASGCRSNRKTTAASSTTLMDVMDSKDSSSEIPSPAADAPSSTLPAVSPSPHPMLTPTDATSILQPPAQQSLNADLASMDHDIPQLPLPPTTMVAPTTTINDSDIPLPIASSLDTETENTPSNQPPATSSDPKPSRSKLHSYSSRIHSASTYVEASMVSDVLGRSQDITLASQLIATFSKYPTLRPYLHADRIRTGRPPRSAHLFWAVVAMRNAFRRDPPPGVGKEKEVCGQLRRCGDVRCQVKTCQRRAWVLHKNWCLKFGDTSTPTHQHHYSTSTTTDAHPVRPTALRGSLRQHMAEAQMEGDAVMTPVTESGGAEEEMDVEDEEDL
ncbi:hypothetical protein BC829DRAFT_404574, partial [Chytridium lagenaria]